MRQQTNETFFRTWKTLIVKKQQTNNVSAIIPLQLGKYQCPPSVLMVSRSFQRYGEDSYLTSVTVFPLVGLSSILLITVVPSGTCKRM